MLWDKFQSPEMRYCRLLPLIILSAMFYACTSGGEQGGAINNPNQKLQPLKIQVVDTVINNDKIHVNWFDSGVIEFRLNGFSDSIKWFPFDEYADRTDHAAMIMAYESKPQKILINDSLIMFTIVDFKSRAVLFLIDRHLDGEIRFSEESDKCINPLIHESSYVFVDLKKNLIINHGGKHQDTESISDLYNLYTYEIIDKCVVVKKMHKSFKEITKGEYEIDLSTFKDAKNFYLKIEAGSKN